MSQQTLLKLAKAVYETANRAHVCQKSQCASTRALISSRDALTRSRELLAKTSRLL